MSRSYNNRIAFNITVIHYHLNRVGWLLLDTCEHVISNFVFDERLLVAHSTRKLVMCLLAIRTKRWIIQSTSTSSLWRSTRDAK